MLEMTKQFKAWRIKKKELLFVFPKQSLPKIHIQLSGHILIFYILASALWQADILYTYVSVFVL